MGKRKNRFQKKKGNGEQKRPERGPKRANYEDIVKDNEDYVNYYKEQKCFDINEFDAFMKAMRTPLPATFRLTGYKKDAKQLLYNMKKFHFEKMKGLEIDGAQIKVPESLPWYPNELAWKTHFSRTQLRSNAGLENFHRFAISETESGYITRQEAVSMIPPLLLDVKPHHKILDMCAAPGSKTAQLIELLHRDENVTIPDGICIANDKDNKRCYMLVHQIQRLNSPCSMIVNHDASQFPEIYVKNSEGADEALRYDRVLCDVPCSGDGTLRKNTDIWRQWKTQNALYLHGLQLRILIRGLELLDEGGILVYSTCSLNPVENEAVVAAAIEKCKGSVELVQSALPDLKWSKGVDSWKVMDKQGKWYEDFTQVETERTSFIHKTMFPPEKVKDFNMQHCMRFLPHFQDTGGFFVAVLRKSKTLPWQKQLRPIIAADSDDVTGESSEPARKKKRWQGGYNEAPFVFFTQQQQLIVESLRNFYGLSDDFPDSQLLTRSHQDKKKRIFFVSKLCKNILENNVDFLKMVNTGVRMFSRCDNTHEAVECDFRIVQDGTECLMKYMHNRKVEVGMSDIVELLSHEQPEYKNMSQQFRQELESEDVGSLLLQFVPQQGDEIEVGFSICAWRGKRSIRLYLNRHERIHHLNLLAQTIPEHLKLNQNSHRKRNEEEKKEEGEQDTKEKKEEEKSA